MSIGDFFLPHSFLTLKNLTKPKLLNSSSKTIVSTTTQKHATYTEHFQHHLLLPAVKHIPFKTIMISNLITCIIPGKNVHPWAFIAVLKYHRILFLMLFFYIFFTRLFYSYKHTQTKYFNKHFSKCCPTSAINSSQLSLNCVN